MNETPQVEFWFDTACPWCWMTSRWATEVASARGFEIEWHPLSLMILNEGHIDNAHAESYQRNYTALRVVEAARRQYGNDVVGKLYTEIGTRIHPDKRNDIEAIIAESLAVVGLPAELATQGVSADGPDDIDAQLRANTDHAMKIAGPDVGVPVIQVNGEAFFGPVVTPAPTGELALQLWDGIVAAASVPGFYELKRGRSKGPQF